MKTILAAFVLFCAFLAPAFAQETPDVLVKTVTTRWST